MAESISEGTLKQWSKRRYSIEILHQDLRSNSWTEIGDHVEQDEEIATIETDKVSCPTHKLACLCTANPGT